MRIGLVFKHYLGEVILAGNDGIVTTFAVVSGFSGAALMDGTALRLSIGVVMLFGLANLFSDGLSMGIGNFLARKAEIEAGTLKPSGADIMGSSIAIFISFIMFGSLPLIPYAIGINNSRTAFSVSIITTFIALVLLGVFKWIVIKKALLRSVVETVLVSGIAAIVAFLVGVFFRA